MLKAQFLGWLFLLICLPAWSAPLPGMPAADQQPAQMEEAESATQVEVANKGLMDYWRQLNFWILQKQREFHRGLADSMEDVSDSKSWSAAWGLILLSFLYGVFHAAGPGHGKAVLTTYLMTQPEKLRRGLLLSFIAALLQGVTAILLVTLLVHLLGRLAREAFSSVVYVEMASFAVIALLGLLLLLRALKHLWQLYTATRASTPAMQQAAPARFQPLTTTTGLSPVKPTAAAGEACPSCGKVHHVAPAQVEGKNLLQTSGLLLSIGLRPCSGAVLVLVVANLLGLWWLGITAVMAMALGTSITVMVLAVLAVKTRDLAWRLLGLQGKGLSWAAVLLGALGGSILLLLGLSLMLGLATAEYHPLGIV